MKKILGDKLINKKKTIKNRKLKIDLVAICEIDKQKLNKTTKKYNVTGYSSFKQLLKYQDLDLVALCTPSGIHAEQAILSSKYGINVITEKPMATRWEHGLNMVRAFDEKGLKLFVVKQNRGNTTIKVLKRALEEKRFGKIHTVQINVFWTRPQEYYDMDKWRGTWEFDGGALMNQASHYIDLLDWLIGPVEKIQAMTSTTRNIEVEDTAVLNVLWRSGALGSVNVTMLTYPKNLEGSITIIGEYGTAKIGGVAVNEIMVWDFNQKADYDRDIMNNNYEPNSVYGNGHNLYYENVMKVFRGEAEADTDGREGLKSLEILIAAYLSARNGKIITLPLDY